MAPGGYSGSGRQFLSNFNNFSFQIIENKLIGLGATYDNMTNNKFNESNFNCKCVEIANNVMSFLIVQCFWCHWCSSL
jgi:hypothetical protein